MEDSSNSPAPAPAPAPAARRDKFAALASRTAPVAQSESAPESASTHQDEAATAKEITAAPAPADSATAVISTASSEPAASSQTPATSRGRDKFSALAARSATTASSATDAETATSSASTSAPSTTARGGHGNKLAALAAANNNMDNNNASVQATSGRGGHGNKLAALAAARSNNSATTQSSTGRTASDGGGDERTAAEIAAALQEANLAKLKEKLSRRNKILQSLDRAEILTCKLLSLAHDTTVALQDVNDYESKDKISELSKAYRATVAELHPLLSTRTADEGEGEGEIVIHPYQNHSYESKHSMYAARVEMRLAQERKQVLKAFADLEEEGQSKQESLSSTMSTETSTNKRQREE